MQEMHDISDRIVFLDALEHSFLSDDDKNALAERAKADGVTPALWNDFNDRLIAVIVRTSERQAGFARGLDAEIDRFTGAYEAEKSVLDRELRAALDALADDDADGRARLWEAYYGKIKGLQGRMLADVRQTSSTVLHDVILATVPARSEE